MSLIVLLSIVMHGLTVTPIMRAIDRKHGRDPDALHDAEAEARAA
jgi:NhaP-type Na+/H+ or K+/H+ antiporter